MKAIPAMLALVVAGCHANTSTCPPPRVVALCNGSYPQKDMCPDRQACPDPPRELAGWDAAAWAQRCTDGISRTARALEQERAEADRRDDPVMRRCLGQDEAALREIREGAETARRGLTGPAVDPVVATRLATYFARVEQLCWSATMCVMTEVGCTGPGCPRPTAGEMCGMSFPRMGQWPDRRDCPTPRDAGRTGGAAWAKGCIESAQKAVQSVEAAVSHARAERNVVSALCLENKGAELAAAVEALRTEAGKVSASERDSAMSTARIELLFAQAARLHADARLCISANAVYITPRPECGP